MDRITFSSWNGKVIDNRKGGAVKAAKVIDFPQPLDGTNIKALMGWNGLVVMDPDADIVSITIRYLKEARKISCGECSVCMIGIDRIVDILEGMIEGRGKKGDLAEISSLVKQVSLNSKCGFGQSALFPVADAVKHFKDAFMDVISGKKKPLDGEYSATVTAPCVDACPAGLDIPGYIELIRNNKFTESLELIRENCILPGVVGRVCPHPCEDACVRKDLDAPLAIRLLKRSAADMDLDRGGSVLKQPLQGKGKNVAVIGAGPAGLAAAYNLRLMGYGVTVFEALPQPGGMAFSGIPEFRLPSAILSHEIDLIKRMGVEIKLKSGLAKVDIPGLKKKGFDAIYIAVGAHKGNSMGVAGEDLGCEGVVDGVEFLRDFNLGKPVESKKKVVIVGGGNVALDCARTCVRLGFKEVEIVYRRSRKEMPAYAEEVEGAIEEGIKIRFLTNPARIVEKDGRLVGVECIKMKLGKPDESGRRRPVPVKGSEFMVKTDMLIPAIGQSPALPVVKADVDLDVTGWNTIAVDPATLMTNIEGVFAGGDCVLGPASLIEALDMGNRAAKQVDCFLQGVSEDGALSFKGVDLKKHRGNGVYVVNEQAKEVALMNPQSRKKSFDEVEAGFTALDARQEADRCLRCYRVVVWEKE